MNVLDVLDKIEEADPGLRMALEHAVFIIPNRLVFRPEYRTMAAIGTSPRAKQILAGLDLGLEVEVGEADGRTVAEELSDTRRVEFAEESARVLENPIAYAVTRMFRGSELIRIIK